MRQHRRHDLNRDAAQYRSPFRNKRLDVIIVVMPPLRILPHYESILLRLTPAPSPVPFRLPGAPARLGPKTSGKDISRRSIFVCSITGAHHVHSRRSRERGTSSIVKISSHSIYGVCTPPLRSRRLLLKAIVSCKWNGRPTSRICNNRVWLLEGDHHRVRRAPNLTVPACLKGPLPGMSGQSTWAGTWRKERRIDLASTVS